MRTPKPNPPKAKARAQARTQHTQAAKHGLLYAHPQVTQARRQALTLLVMTGLIVLAGSAVLSWLWRAPPPLPLRAVDPALVREWCAADARAIMPTPGEMTLKCV